MTETAHPTSFHQLCANPEGVPSEVSSKMLEQALDISTNRTQALAVVKALVAEALFEHMPKDGQKTYREAMTGNDHDERELLVEVDVNSAADTIISMLQLDADHEDLICDSDGVTGVQLDGIVTIPFRCPDCA